LRANFLDVCLGEFAYTVEGLLQLLLIEFEVFVGRVVGDDYHLSEAHQDAGKRFGDDQTIPGVQDPGAIDGHMKCAQRNAGRSGEGDRAGLYFAARAAWAVECEGYGPTFLQGAAQAEQGADGVAGAGAFDGDESEFADDASHVFAVVAVAAHHADADVAADVGCGNHAGVPEGDNQRPLIDGLLRSFFAGNADAQCWADEADEPVSDGDDDPEDDALVEGEAVGGGSGFWGNRRCHRARFVHAVIVKEPARRMFQW
jgi:hypothetical protein